MATTPNYGWVTPAPTDFVTDLPADFETFADAVDADLAGLLGGTTGQVLVKNSGTDHDFDFATDPVQDLITTAGDLVYGTAADTLARLGIGTAGQVLTVNSGATAPEWATAPTGGMTLLASGSLSGSSVSITTISQDYLDLVVYVSRWNASADANLHLRINNVSSGYAKVYQNFANTTYSGTGAVNQTAAHLTNYTQKSDQPGSTVARIYNYSFGGNQYRNLSYWSSGVNNGGFFAVEQGNIGLTDSTTVTRVDLLPSTGTFDTGTYALYGVK